VRDAGEAGAARISLGSGLARVAHRAAVEASRAILDPGDFSALAAGLPGKEVDALLARGAEGASERIRD